MRRRNLKTGNHLVSVKLEGLTVFSWKCSVFQLIATGPDAQQQWRRRAPASFQTRLGRETTGGWSVPWDLRISRNHADITFHDDRLEIRCLESARNPAVVDGQSARQFYIRPGEEFRIGFTTFRLEETATEERTVREVRVINEDQVASELLLRKLQRSDRHKDRSKVVNNLEAVLHFLNESDEADFEPQSIDDHLPLDSSASWPSGTPIQAPGATNEQLASENELLRREVASSVSEQKRLTALLLQSHRDAQALRKELSLKQIETEDAERTTETRRKEQHAQLDERLAAAVAEHQRQLNIAAEKLSSAETQSTQLSNQIAQMCEERLALLNQLDGFRESEQQSRELEAQIHRRYEQQLTALTEALSQQQDAAAEKNQAVGDAQRQLESSVAENEQLKESLDKLKQDPATPEKAEVSKEFRDILAAAMNTESELRANLAQIKTRLQDELQAKHDSLKQLNSLRCETEKKSKEDADLIRGANERAAEKQQVIESLQTTCQAWQTRAEQKAESHHQVSRELRRLMEEIAANQLEAAQTKEDMQAEVAQRDDDLELLKAEIVAIETRLQLNLDIAAAADLEQGDPPADELQRLRLFANRRGNLIEWLREKLESTKSRLQREAAQRRKINAYARRLEKDLERSRLTTDSDHPAADDPH